MPAKTLEQLGEELHACVSSPCVLESHTALLRAADAELARGREARELLRQICGRAEVWNGHRELELTADGRRWLASHPEVQG